MCRKDNSIIIIQHSPLKREAVDVYKSTNYSRNSAEKHDFYSVKSFLRMAFQWQNADFDCCRNSVNCRNLTCKASVNQCPNQHE